MAKVLWTQKQDVGPSGRGEHAIAYDAARQRVVLFGGRAGGGTLQGDTWEWDGGNWTQVADTGPDARGGHALAFDANRQRALLFGGVAAGSALRGDTWEWDGEDWTQVADTGPDARGGHALAFDANRQRALLFGGEAGSGLRADTWEWDGAHWTQEADTGPGPSLAPAMTFVDASAGTSVGGASGTTFLGSATLLFGGVTSSPAHIAVEALSPAPDAIQELSRLSWEWDGAQWTLRQDMGPAPRWGHALAFDSARGRAVLFGGFSAPPADPDVADSVLADTWEASIEEIPVDVSGPALVSFTLSPDLVFSEASWVGVRDVSFQVGLDGPAPPGGVQVDIFGGEVVVLSVLVAEGETTGSRTRHYPWPGVTASGDHELQARLGDVALTAVLLVA